MTVRTKSFLYWVGGKARLVKRLMQKIPAKFNDYYEPFLGAGSLLFALKPAKAFISDASSELIKTYKELRDNTDEVIKLLEIHDKNKTKENFFELRTKLTKSQSVEAAAAFIHVNRFCYGGIFRINNLGFCTSSPAYNSRGNDTDYITRAKECGKVLQNAEIVEQDFSKIKPSKNDFVYLDPPYHKIKKDSYTKYGGLDFTEEDQIRLYEKCVELDKAGVSFMLSNSNTDFIKALYKDFDIDRLKVQRCITSTRVAADEVIIRNYN